MRRPTEKQLARLMLLSKVGTVVIAPGKRDWEPLLKRGLVEQPLGWTGAERRVGRHMFLPPLAITGAGMRAVAEFREEHGHWPGEKEWDEPVSAGLQEGSEGE